VGLIIVFLLAWGYVVVKWTRHLGEEGAKKYHEIDPAGFEQGKKAGGSY